MPGAWPGGIFRGISIHCFEKGHFCSNIGPDCSTDFGPVLRGNKFVLSRGFTSIRVRIAELMSPQKKAKLNLLSLFA